MTQDRDPETTPPGFELPDDSPGFLLAGSSVLGWHIYALVLRWALTLAMRWNMRVLASG